MTAISRRRTIALIDYDNARIEPITAERNAGAVQVGCLSIIEALTAALVASGASYGEIRARFYGGWLHEDGRWTERAEWMREELRNMRGLRHGIRLLPELAVALMSQPRRDIRGTARIRTDRSGYSHQQKMVDTMLCVDLVLMSLAPDEDIVVVSDDDDVIPAMIVAQATLGRIRLFRHRELGKSCNDHHLRELGLPITVFRPVQ